MDGGVVVIDHAGSSDDVPEIAVHRLWIFSRMESAGSRSDRPVVGAAGSIVVGSTQEDLTDLELAPTDEKEPRRIGFPRDDVEPDLDLVRKNRRSRCE